MEPLRNSSGDELLGALQVRKHKGRKAKTSSVSARLNPNFDAKTLALNSATNTQLNTVNTHASQDKPPPCLAPTPLTIVTNLEKMSLVDRQEITPSFKISMLKATLNFLKDSSRLTLQYPEMSLTNAQFLYNLIDPSKDRDGNVGFGFKSLYSSLYEIMHELKKEMKFKVCFESTLNDKTTKLMLTKVPNKLKTKEVLSTKKKYKKNISNDARIIQEFKNQNWYVVSSTSSSGSECATTRTKAGKKVFTRESIVKSLPELFLRCSLQMFLDFITDPQMASLEFTDVNVPESRFLECLTWTSISSFTSPRADELGKLFRGWKLSSVFRRRMEFVPRSPVVAVCRDQRSRDQRSRYQEGSNPDYKGGNCPACFGGEWSLCRGVLLWLCAEISEAEISEADIRREVIRITSEKCEALLKRIRRAVRRGEWSLRIEVGKLKPPPVRTRTVTFFKTPCYKTNSDTEYATVDDTTKELGKAVKFANAFNIAVKDSSESDRSFENASQLEYEPGNKASNIETPRVDVCEARKPKKKKSKKKKSKPNKSDNTESKSGTDESTLDQSDTKEATVTSSESDSDRCKRNISTDSKGKGDSNKNLILPGEKKGHRKLTAISFQSAGSLTLEEVSGGAGDGVRGAGGVDPPLASRKARLLKALATPIEGGVAERIMRNNMGWEGGALGVRGEGIVEPIMPAIHLKPGAGLGHVKPPAPPTVSVASCRLKLLATLLSLLRSSSTEASISFSQPVTAKHFRFFKPVLKSLNRRRKPGWEGPEVDLLKEIMEEMSKAKNVDIDFDVSKDLKEFYLWKGPKPVLMSETMESTSDDAIRVIVDAANDIESPRASRKGAESLAYKIQFLENFKEFCANDDESAEYTFDCVMNKTRKRYLEMVVLDMNRGVLVRRHTDAENEVLREIWKVGKEWTVNIKFGERSFKLSKKLLPLNKNKITNTETEPPRLISADLKNTIIYVNNKAIPAEKYVETSITCKDNTTTNDGKVADEAVNDVHNIDDRSTDKNDAQANTTSYEKKFNIANDIKAFVSDSKHDNNYATDIDRLSKKSYKVSAIDSANDVNMYGCDANKNVKDESIISISDEDSKFVLPDSDELDSSLETNKDLETDLESSNDVSKSKTKGKHENVNNDAYMKNRDGNIKKDNKLRSFINEKAASDDKFTFPITDDSVANVTDNIESDFESSNADLSLEVGNNSITEGLDDNVSTKFNLLDTEYDNFKSNLQSEVNNNRDVDKNRNQTYAEYLPNSSPKKRSSSTTDKRSPKTRKFVKLVSLSRKDGKDIGMESVKFIQKLILDVIDENVFLPLLKCHGIQNGVLIYSCHNQDSCAWLKTVMNIVSDVQMNDINYSVNMFSFKITSFVEEESATVLNRLQMYNKGLSTEEWKVLKEQQCKHFSEFHVRVDKNSFRYICENNFSLYVGVDTAQFNILWN